MHPLAQSNLEGALLVAAMLLGFIALRFTLNKFDKSQIKMASQKKGWKCISIKWSPFAPGWFFEKGERHYQVTYQDSDGVVRKRYCKTSVLTGVYWRD